MSKLLKLLIFFLYIIAFTFLLWGFSLVPKPNEVALQYLVFASQLLYGNMCYDILKTLRIFPSEDEFWPTASRICLGIGMLILIVGSSLVLAAKIFPLTYVGLLVAVAAYGYIFVVELPKLQPAYLAALKRNDKSRH